MAMLYDSFTNFSSMAAIGVVSNICATSPCIESKIGLQPSLNFFLSVCGRSLVLTKRRGRIGVSTISPLSFFTLKSGNPVIQWRHARIRSTDGKSKPSGTSICLFPAMLLPNVQNPSAPDKILKSLFVTTFVFMNSWRVSATRATSSFISVSIAGMSGISSAIVSATAAASFISSSSSLAPLASSCRIAMLFVSNADFICPTERLKVCRADPIVFRMLINSLF
mmetsp:Transcript_3052/g.6700  ORF Transcript_3052/g.6700 Transcript_3052/m.6700 type:complete len:223 (-) Transcript_3052:714-1382(-)